MAEETERWIIVAERGFVYVGNVHRDADQVVIDNCYNIRRWGTTRGLGQIAEDGPTESSVLDKCPRVKVHVMGVVHQMQCNEESWRRWETRVSAKAKK